MPALLTMIIPALVPAIADGFRGLLGKLTGGTGALPQNVDEQIKLMTAQAEMLKSLAQLDQPSANISLWVANLRASFRYIAAGIIIVAAVLTMFTPNIDKNTAAMAWDAANIVFSFMFGDKMYSYLRRGK